MKGQLGNLMKQAQKMQADAAKVQEEINQMQVEGQAGGGLVSIVMTGAHEAKRVTIDPSVLADDKDMLEDLIAAAINDCAQKIQKATQDKMGALTSGLNLPGGFKLPF